MYIKMVLGEEKLRSEVVTIQRIVVCLDHLRIASFTLS